MDAVQRSDLVPSTRFLLTAWILAGLMLLILLGSHDVSRSQEARVLETARQMLDADWRGWLLPQLNGEPRLRKPPLCYWYTAVSYQLFGVNEFSGRLPTVLLAWLALGMTYLLGRDIASHVPPTARDYQRGFFAAAALAGSFFFVRFSRSAETDLPTLLGTVTAFWALLRSRGGGRWYLHLAALGIAFNAMTKGPPALYPLLFLLILCIADRSARLLKRFVTSGALVSALVLSGAWWVYALSNPAGTQVAEELKVIAKGGTHFGFFLEYVPILMLGLLPWTPFYLLGFLYGLFEWKRDQTFRTIVYAIMAVFLPLVVSPQVQPHYLVPMLPCCATLVGWIIVRTINGELDARWTSIMSWAFRATLLAFLLAGPAVLGAGYLLKKLIGPTDLLAAAALVGSSLAILVVFRRRTAGLQIAAWATVLAAAIPVVAGWWAPSLDGNVTRELAREVELAYGDRPLLAYGDDSNIALGFHLKRIIPRTRSLEEVRAFVEAFPDGVVITERHRSLDDGPPLPYLLEETLSGLDGDEIMEFHTRIDGDDLR
jgi:4-amino-4-deoxy-L-arabinose transferase-like glycosyltransferase